MLKLHDLVLTSDTYIDLTEKLYIRFNSAFSDDLILSLDDLILSLEDILTQIDDF